MSNKFKGMYENNGKWDVLNPNMITKALRNAQKRLLNKSIEEIYTIDFKGYKFNILPFLLNGTEYYGSTYIHILQDMLVSEDFEEFEKNLEKMQKDKLLDINVFKSLIPHYSGHMHRDLTAYLHIAQPYKMAAILFVQASSVFKEMIIGNYLSYIKFGCEGICNTQAFCFYINIEWILQNAPELKMMVQKQLSHFKYKELINSWCPDDCIHMKYIKGEIDSEELFRLYKKETYSDNSSICQRELISLCTDGEYDGRDLLVAEKELCDNLYYTMTNDKLGIVDLCLAASAYPRVDGLQNDIKNKEIQCDALLKEKEEIQQRLKLQREAVVKMKNDIKDLETENAKLRTELAQMHTNEDLLKKISELKDEVCSLEKENNKLFNERFELKQLISTQKKQLRTLKPLETISIEDENIQPEIISDEKFDMDKAISVLKDKSYIIVGADSINTIDANFEKYKFKNIKRFKTSVKTLGNCDCVIIFTQRCRHDEVYLCESLGKHMDVKFVYANNSNFNMLIKLLYNTLSE